MQGIYDFTDSGNGVVAGETNMPSIELLQNWFREKIAEKTSLAPDAIDICTPISRYGLSSIEMLSISGELEEWLGCELSPSVLYEYDTIQKCSGFLKLLLKNAQAPQEKRRVVERIFSPAAGPTVQNAERLPVEQVLAELIDQGIALWQEDGQLRVSALEQMLTTEMQEKLKNNSTALVKFVGREKYLPLSASQKRYLIMAMIHPGKATYNNPVGIRFRGALDIPALESAVLHVIRRHDILRATFSIISQTPVQVIAQSPDNFQIPIRDISLIKDERARAEKLSKMIEAESSTAINPLKQPGIRLQVIKLSIQEHVLLVTVHHTIFDGFAFGSFIQELFTGYEKERSGVVRDQLPPVQYLDYILREHEEKQKYQADLAYWRETLKDALPCIKLPLDYERPVVNSQNGSSQALLIPAEIYAALKKRASNNDVSIFAALLAAFKVLLLKWTGQNDLVVGTVVQNRTKKGHEDILGDFTNFLPLRSILQSGQTFLAAAKLVNAVVQQALAHKDCPFEKIAEAVGKAPGNINPVYNIHVTQLPRQSEIVVHAELTAAVSNHRMFNRSAMMDLRLEWNESPDGLNLVCEYNTDIFTEATIRNVLKNFRDLLEQITEDPLVRIGDYRTEFQYIRDLEPKNKIQNGPAVLAAEGTEFRALVSQLKKIYAAVVQAHPDSIEIHQNFFEMGGSSLKAVQLMHELESQALPIDISDVFKYPSIQLLAENLCLKKSKINPVATVPSPVPAFLVTPTDTRVRASEPGKSMRTIPQAERFHHLRRIRGHS